MDNTEYLKQLAEAEKKNKQTELEQAKAAALQTIQQQEEKTMPTFTTQRKQANVQSQLGAKNLAEYWANRGQTNAGISAQAELSRGNVLGNTLNTIGQSEAAQQLSFNQQKAAEEQDYQNKLINYTNAADLQLQQDLYDEKLRLQNLAKKSSGGSSGSKPKTEKLYEVVTDYYKGKINPDTKYGTFNSQDSQGNYYQPDNVGGNKLSKTGYMGEVNGVTQNIWKYMDKNGNYQYVYWDGRYNKYMPTKNPAK